MTTTLPTLHLVDRVQRAGTSSCRSARCCTRARRHTRRGFSLIEVLLAIFILGVGVISIAALFPAGIAQQRQSVDDVLGPTIANNALSILRTKLKPEDFGTFEQFATTASRFTIPGDFTWLRPGFIFRDDPATPNIDERGAINIFSSGAWDASEFPAGYAGSTPTLEGLPYNRALYATPPRILFSQTERYYPAGTQNGTLEVGRPQYVWDCMFRRFQGRVLVAIFVYRVTQPGGGGPLYIVPENPSAPTQSPLPVWLDLTQASVQATSCATGPWHPGGLDADPTTTLDNAFILGVPSGVGYDPDDMSQSWQEPRQWILDQNNNVHRVLGAFRDDINDDAEIELVRPAPRMPAINAFYIGAGVNPPMVSDIWYIPAGLQIDTDGDATPDTPVVLTPVYATVKEL